MDGAQDLGEGITRIVVPMIGNPLKHTLVYVMESPGGLILVDTGWDDEPAWEGLNAGFASMGASLADIEGVVVTHFHPDHTGLCRRVREASGAWIAMHFDDHALFKQMTSPRDGEACAAERANLAAAGAPEEFLDTYLAAFANMMPTTAESAPDRLLADGERIPLRGRALRAVHTPGHTPGHVCFALEGTDTLFTGDHVLARTTPHVGNHVFPVEERDPLGEFLDSQRRISAVGGTRGLGSHGAVVEDVPARAAELIAHHDERLADLLTAFGDDEITAWEVATRMHWHRRWDDIPPLGRTMALSEAAAHLRHLMERGTVVAVPGSNPARFRRAA